MVKSWSSRRKNSICSHSWCVILGVLLRATICWIPCGDRSMPDWIRAPSTRMFCGCERSLARLVSVSKRSGELVIVFRAYVVPNASSAESPTLAADAVAPDGHRVHPGFDDRGCIVHRHGVVGAQQ